MEYNNYKAQFEKRKKYSQLSSTIQKIRRESQSPDFIRNNQSYSNRLSSNFEKKNNANNYSMKNIEKLDCK